jgi:rubrerythrin
MGPVDVTHINSAFGTIKSLFDLVKQLIDRKGAGKNKPELADWQAKLISAQSALLEMQQQYQALIAAKENLEQEITKLKAWSEDKADYELKEIAAGVFAYAYAPKTDPIHPPHWLCPKCYHEGKKSILNPMSERSSPRHRCPTCHEIYGFRAPPISFKKLQG